MDIKIINGKTELMELLSDEKFYDLVEPIKDELQSRTNPFSPLIRCTKRDTN